jgi:hypothetical protein
MRITCDRCGKDRVISETHANAAQRDMPIREITTAAAAGQVELMAGIDGASSRPVRKIVLRCD